MNYLELSKKFHSFEYNRYNIDVDKDVLRLSFEYALIGDEIITFIHKVTYKVVGNEKVDFSNIDELKNFVFHIGMVETINYWKLACPKRVKINCGHLREPQKNWWKKLYYNGLGEFIYLNNMAELVDMDSFVEFESKDESLDLESEVELSVLKTAGNLIPVGGGKDSVVTLEVLRDSKSINLPFVMSPPIAAYDCIDVAGYKGYLEAKRIFDKKIMVMNSQGYLNGHVPFSAILAFISTLGAALMGKQYIPLSNERSANEPSVIGTTFNHQYSKSFEFEEDFAYYLHSFLTKDIKYFSLLRPLYELQIGEMFANYTGYHPIYRSCNRGKKENVWCGVCPKCLFVYIILSPYVDREKLIKQFGKDLLEDMNLKPIFDELIGLTESKPFECVGTIWEVRHAINLTIKKYDDAGLLQYYRSINGESLVDSPSEYEEGDLLPEEHREILLREMSLLEK